MRVGIVYLIIMLSLAKVEEVVKEPFLQMALLM